MFVYPAQVTYLDRYTPNGVYTIYERDEFDPSGDDRLRLYWDHETFRQQWSLRYSWLPSLPSDPPLSRMQDEESRTWPRDALLREFPQAFPIAKKAPNEELAFMSPSVLSAGQRRDCLRPTTEEFSKEIFIIAEGVQAANVSLMEWLAEHPEHLYRIHPGTFENIIAELFRAKGYDVKVLTQWNQPDGGIDIIAIRKNTAVGEFRIGIQCKRFVKMRKVRADIVWCLQGRLDKFKLHKGVVATTARFEMSVLKECKEHLWKIELMDFERLRSELENWRQYRRDGASGLYLK